jgi:hypothetical protein
MLIHYVLIQHIIDSLYFRLSISPILCSAAQYVIRLLDRQPSILLSFI